MFARRPAKTFSAISKTPRLFRNSRDRPPRIFLTKVFYGIIQLPQAGRTVAVSRCEVEESPHSIEHGVG